jgi:hypothetical protein
MIILKLIMPNLYYFQKQAVIFRTDILLIRKFFESKAEEKIYYFTLLTKESVMTIVFEETANAPK